MRHQTWGASHPRAAHEPPGSARLDGALNLPVQSICAGAQLTHQGLPTAPVVTAIVVEQLTADEVVPLAAADCARLGG